MTRMNQHRFRCLPLAAAVLLSSLSATAHADNACHYIEQANLELTHPDNARLPTVMGEINGKPVHMEINTGASDTFMMRSEADRQNLNPERMAWQVQSMAGSKSMFLVKVKDFAIGGAHATNLRFPVIEGMEHTDVAGIIGADFLMHYDLDLDFTGNRVKLFEADHCQDKALAYWDDKAMSVPLEFTSERYRPLVQVQINGKPIWALISTGSARSTLDVDAARRLGLSTDAPGVTYRGKTAGAGNEKVDYWNMTLDSFTLGDEVIQHPRIVVAESTYQFRGRKQYDMVLGRDFLSAHHVLLAQSQKRIYYTYNGGTVFLKDEINAIGLPRAAP